MSELQAILQARRRRLASSPAPQSQGSHHSNQDDGRTSNANLDSVPEVQTTKPPSLPLTQAPPRKHDEHKPQALSLSPPRSPKRNEQRNWSTTIDGGSESDAIEVSPTGAGREALRLNMSTAPPSMPSSSRQHQQQQQQNELYLQQSQQSKPMKSERSLSPPSELQRKLRERRMKAAETLKHVKQSQSQGQRQRQQHQAQEREQVDQKQPEHPPLPKVEQGHQQSQQPGDEKYRRFPSFGTDIIHRHAPPSNDDGITNPPTTPHNPQPPPRKSTFFPRSTPPLRHNSTGSQDSAGSTQAKSGGEITATAGGLVLGETMNENHASDGIYLKPKKLESISDDEDDGHINPIEGLSVKGDGDIPNTAGDDTNATALNDHGDKNNHYTGGKSDNVEAKQPLTSTLSDFPPKESPGRMKYDFRRTVGGRAAYLQNSPRNRDRGAGDRNDGNNGKQDIGNTSMLSLMAARYKEEQERQQRLELEEKRLGHPERETKIGDESRDGDEEHRKKQSDPASLSPVDSKSYSGYSSSTTRYYRPGMTPKNSSASNQSPRNNLNSWIDKNNNKHLEERKQRQESEGEDKVATGDESRHGTEQDYQRSDLSSPSNTSKGHSGYADKNSGYHRPGMKPNQATSPTNQLSQNNLNKWMDQRKDNNMPSNSLRGMGANLTGTGRTSFNPNIPPPSPSSLATTAPATKEYNKSHTRRSIDGVVARNEEDEVSATTDNSIPEFMRTRLKPTTPKSKKSSVSASAVDNDTTSVASHDGPRKPPKIVRGRWSPSQNTHPVSSPLAAQTGPKSPAPNQRNSLQSSDDSNRLNQPPWERSVAQVNTENNQNEEAAENTKISQTNSVSSKIAHFQNTNAKLSSLPSNVHVGSSRRGVQSTPAKTDQNSSYNATTKRAQDKHYDTDLHDVQSRDQHEMNHVGDHIGENLQEEVLDKNDSDGNRFHDQYDEFHYVSNYDAAVLAAKEAIDTSNRTRTHRSRHYHHNFPSVEGGGYNIEGIGQDNEHDEVDVGDPQIQMEPSPSSSVVVGPSELDLSETKLFPSEIVDNEGEYSFDEEEAKDKFNDLHPNTNRAHGFSPSSLADQIDESDVSGSHSITASAVFGSSFLESSNIFGTESNEDIFPSESEQFDEDLFFASDPFATSSGGIDEQIFEQETLNGQCNFYGNEQREERPNAHIEESPSFEAESEHSRGHSVDAQESTMGDVEAENSNEITPIAADSHKSVRSYSIIEESSSIEEITDASADSFLMKNSSTEVELEYAGVDAKKISEDTLNPKLDSHRLYKDESSVSTDSSHSDESEMSTEHNYQTGVLATFSISDLKLPTATVRDIGRTTPSPISNPLTGNIISCWCDDRGDFFVEEFIATHSRAPIVALSVRLLTPEFEEKVVRSNALSKGSKIIGVKSVLSLAAGVHRVKGLARVRVAAITEVVVASTTLFGSFVGKKTIRAVVVWKWGYNPGRREVASLQSVLSISDTEEETNREFKPDTLQVADGLVFLGGHVFVSGSPVPSIFIAKPAVRDGWVTVHIEPTNILSQQAPLESAHIERQVGLSVSVLCVTDEANTYIAVGLTDGSISVWSYDLAVRTNRISVATVRTNNSNQAIQSPSLLQPLCRIGGEYDVTDLSDGDCLWPRKKFYTSLSINRSRIESFRDSDSDRLSLAWVRQSSSGISSLPLLAVACSSGVAVYHVSLSLQKELSAPVAESLSELSSCSDELLHTKMQRNRAKKGYPILKEPASSSIARAEIISPLAKASFMTKKSRSEVESSGALTNLRAKVGWFDLGPRSIPCLSILLENANMMRLCLCPVDIPWYGSIEVFGSDASKVYRRIGVLCEYELSPREGRTELLNLANIGCVGVSFSGGFIACKPMITNSQNNSGVGSFSRNDGYFSQLSLPAASSSLGLDNEGCVFHSGSKSSVKSSYQDAILSVYSIITCKRQEEELDGIPPVKPISQKWSVPSQRHWLLLSSAGDITIDGLQRNQAIDEEELTRDSLQNEAVKAGATTDVLCELTCGENPVSGLVPERIVREYGGRRAAVLFSKSYFGHNFRTESHRSHARFRTQARIPQYPVAYAIIDIDVAMKQRGSSSFDLRHGRDVAFLPPSQTEGDFYCSSVVVLGPDGSDIFITTIISSCSPRDGDKTTVVESINKCSLQTEGIEGQRVFALLNGDHPKLLIAGFSAIVGRPCLILSNYSFKEDTDSNFLILVEDHTLGHRLWLRNGEQILSLVELPKRVYDDRANIAVATQERVMILSTSKSLTIIAEIDACITCTSLSPIGSHCVGFCASSFTSSGFQIMYLSCLKSEGRHGIISKMSSHHREKTRPLLLGLRPDRFSCHLIHGEVCLVDDGEDEDKFLAPIPLTYPSFLLEPLIANAICQDGEYGAKAPFDAAVQQCLRTVIEKFGRKQSSFPHSDHCGIGSLGTGLTTKVFKILERYNCKQAASFLLTGFPPNDMASKPTILPPWIPMRTKCSAAFNVEILLQVLSCGDNGLAEALRRQDCELSPGVLPKPNDPPSIFAQDLAFVALMNESFRDAVKLLKFSGSSSSESAILQLALGYHSESCADMNCLSCLANDLLNEAAQFSNQPSLSSQVAAVVTARAGGLSSEMSPKIPAKRFSPTFNAHSYSGRAQAIMKNAEAYSPLAALRGAPTETVMDCWKHRLDEGKHIWGTGPFDRTDEILELENFAAWIGRYRPSLLGEEGVAIAADRGERTLADILSNAAKEEVTSKSEEGSLSQRNDSIWVQGIGEGRQDEDNLSLYIRFSEGADEDDLWKTDGFTDLTKYGHKAQLFGSELASLEATTSSADEGEEGKVRVLYDLVYSEGAPRNRATGLAIEVLRGTSLDIGMLHASHNKSRQKCTIEFWYRLPEQKYVEDEIILARRSLLDEEQTDESTFCLPDEKLNTLWELAVLPIGSLELRSGAGSVVSSAVLNHGNDDECDGLVMWGRDDGRGGWNHVCLIFSSIRHSSPTECFASILMNGITIVDSISFSVNPFGLEADHGINQVEIDEAMQKSIMAFGIGPSVGFRITDIRVWACHRAEEDVRMMMYEHLRDAEMKKKFKVKIRSGPKASGVKTSGLLAPPLRQLKPELKYTVPVIPPPNSSSSLSRYDGGTDEEDKGSVTSCAAFDSNDKGKSKSVEICESNHRDGAPSETRESDAPNPDRIENEVAKPNVIESSTTKLVDELTIDTFLPKDGLINFYQSDQSKYEHMDDHENSSRQAGSPVDTPQEVNDGDEHKTHLFEVTVSDLISSKVRKSAAAAILRGPPATRHFGGNRAGISSTNGSGSKPGVGPIAICGAEKSIVFYSDREPSGKTLPIGASGAVLSDIMDQDQSEYMCCFLSKEKRVVVFELSRKTVVVELQMKTKLNFWRYLPPELHGSDLTFLFITPIGGFHWKPLNESPRPRQVWKRGSELASKKILAYEEGGSNGGKGTNASSTVALVTASSVASGSPVEAYCISLDGQNTILPISHNITGTALYHPLSSVPSPTRFLPLLVTVVDEQSRFILCVESLIDGDGNSCLRRGNILASVVLDINDEDSVESYEPPVMSIGSSPEALCCCKDGFIVTIIRRLGLVLVYDFSNGDLSHVGKCRLNQYIVDAAIREGDAHNGADFIELFMLVSENEDPKDGRIASIKIERTLRQSIQ